MGAAQLPRAERRPAVVCDGASGASACREGVATGTDACVVLLSDSGRMAAAAAAAAAAVAAEAAAMAGWGVAFPKDRFCGAVVE
mmetsp:Transcript_37819/g.111972  ORF Transcript_37819/g.111972 Transcript_37819/m.111972 type:complete len:84 (-) Transcript_37819:950-1201(-)